MTPKCGFGVALLPVGALCFYQAHFRCFQDGHFGRISSSVYFTVFQSLGGGCFHQARVTQAVILPSASFHGRAFALPPCVPPNPHAPTPTFRVSDYFYLPNLAQRLPDDCSRKCPRFAQRLPDVCRLCQNCKRSRHLISTLP